MTQKIRILRQATTKTRIQIAASPNITMPNFIIFEPNHNTCQLALYDKQCYAVDLTTKKKKN
jgi:hypothetical protein